MRPASAPLLVQLSSQESTNISSSPVASANKLAAASIVLLLGTEALDGG